MKKPPSLKAWLPLARGAANGTAELPTGAAFRGEWIDFERGLRVGNLEPHERITQIFKYHLESRYRQPFTCDRWGRGVFWQWICWVPRKNRDAKPVSHDVNWSCAKFFISVDQEERVFKAGAQVERGPAEGPEEFPGCVLKPDWDWHRFAAGLRAGSALERELARLIRRDDFVARIGDWERMESFNAKNFRSAAQLRAALRRVGPRDWVGFQLYYPFPEKEVRSMTGHELVQAVAAVFGETTPAMNTWMQVPLETAAG
ncbi:MAG: hypothetical protein HZA91_11100 [Verrucomicrobia bacterium]|nr:hypothetical protein [Verrucomicrobiota bacterium]